MAAAKEISTDAAIKAVSLEMDDLFTLKDKHKTGTKGFSRYRTCFIQQLVPSDQF